MQFSIQTKKLTQLLTFVIGVVEKKQVLPILSHVLFSIKNNQLRLTASDLELELICSLSLDTDVKDAEISLPARKLLDICKSLHGDSPITFDLQDHVMHVSAETAKFRLMTLPASQFPKTMERGTMEQVTMERGHQQSSVQFYMQQSDLKNALERVAFAMAVDDFRYYLNGTLIEIIGNKACFVATDTHRLAYTEQQLEQTKQKHKSIVPRKAVYELIRLLSGEESVEIKLSDQSIQVSNNLFTFTSKLLEGEFPNYQRAIPAKNHQVFRIHTALLKEALSRATLLLDQKIQGLYMHLDQGTLKIMASNQDNEQSEEILHVDYTADALQVSYNAGYLLDILHVMHTEQLYFYIADNRSAMLEQAGVIADNVATGTGNATADDKGTDISTNASLYLVMPIRD